MEAWLVVFILGELAFVAAITWIVAHYRQRRLEQRAGDRARLLERIGSGREVMEFLATEPGRRFLRLVALEQPDPRKPVIRAVGAGLFLLVIGGGFILLARLNIPDHNAFVIPGALSLLSGIAVLLAAGVSFLLGRRWGLGSREEDDLPFATGAGASPHPDPSDR